MSDPTDERMRIISRAEPFPESDSAEHFYARSLKEMTNAGFQFLVAGTYAVSAYTGISRPTKDLDIFCRAGDAPRILAHFKQLGFAAEYEDERWLGKVHQGQNFFDVIFASSNGTMPVGDVWFEHARHAEMLGLPLLLVNPTELIWSKAFVQLRHRYDGADIMHVILRAHDHIDWQRLLGHMELYWEVLLIHLLNFRWIYPSERERVPVWLLDELLGRLASHRQLPPPRIPICRGLMYSLADYEIDVREWGYSDLPEDRRRSIESGSD